MTILLLVVATLIGAGLFAACTWLLHGILTDDDRMPHMIRLALVLIDIGMMIFLVGSVHYLWRTFYV